MKSKIHIKSKKSMKFLIVLSLFACVTTNVFCQTTEWIAFQKSSKLTQVRGLGVDNYENVYSVATFDNELKVGSSSAYQDSFGTYWPWKQHVFTKHSVNGKLLYTTLIETRGGNSNMAEVRKMHVTSDGRIIAHLICKRDFYYVDHKRNETKLRSGYNQTSILVIGNNGELLKHIPIPIRDCSQIIDDDLGNIFVLARNHFRNTSFEKQLYRIDYALEEAVEINFTEGKIHKLHCFNGKLWIATLEKDKKRGYLYAHKVGLFSSDLTDLKSFSENGATEVGVSHFCDLQFLNKGNNVKLVLISRALSEFTLKGKKLAIRNGEMGLLVLNSKLELENYTTFKGLQHNLRLTGLKDGSMILQYSVLDSVVFDGKLVQVYPRHSNFIYELVHVKLNSDLHFQWVVNGGGTASNYHVSEMALNKAETKIYVGSDLLDYGKFDSGYVENDWRSSYYIRKIELLNY